MSVPPNKALGAATYHHPRATAAAIPDDRRTLAAYINDFYDVREFGALGNDSADDTIAIQNCIDRGISAQGGVGIYIPTGVYKITKPLIAVTNSKTIFLGDGVNVKQGKGSIIKGYDPIAGTPGLHSYLLYTGHPATGGETAIALVRGLGFINTLAYQPHGGDPPQAGIPDPFTLSQQGNSRAGTGNVIRINYTPSGIIYNPNAVGAGDNLGILKEGYPITLFVSGISGVTTGSYAITNTYGPTRSISSTAAAAGGTNTRINFASSIVYLTGDYISVKNSGTNIDGTWSVVNAGTNFIDIPCPFSSPASSGTVEAYWIELPGTTFTVAGSGGSLKWDGDGCGGIWTVGLSGRIDSCEFMIGSGGVGGCGIFQDGFKVLITSCSLYGPLTSVDTSTDAHRKSVGIAARDAAVENCYFEGFGTAGWGFRSGIAAAHCTVKRCVVGLTGGAAPVALPYDYVELDDLIIQPRDKVYLGGASGSVCKFIDCSSRALYNSGGASNSICTSSGSFGTPKQGLAVNVANGYFGCAKVTGVYSISGFGLANDGENNTSNGGGFYENLSCTITGGSGVEFRYYSGTNPQEVPGMAVGCDRFSFALNFIGFAGVNQFPSQISMTSVPSVCVDSIDASWVVGGSNAGKGVTSPGGGTPANEVLLGWDGTKWAIVG